MPQRLFHTAIPATRATEADNTSDFPAEVCGVGGCKGAFPFPMLAAFVWYFGLPDQVFVWQSANTFPLEVLELGQRAFEFLLLLVPSAESAANVIGISGSRASQSSPQAWAQP